MNFTFLVIVMGSCYRSFMSASLGASNSLRSNIELLNKCHATYNKIRFLMTQSHQNSRLNV